MKKLPLFTVLLAHFLTILDIFIVNVALPSIQQSIKATNSQMQLVVAVYMIGFAAFLVLGGKLGDYFGRKRIFITGMIVFMLASIGCGTATTPLLLVAMRFLQGISAAVMSPQVLSFIQLLFPKHEERTYAIGWYGITIGIGTMLGQFLGGFLVELPVSGVIQPWRFIFLLNTPICLIGLMLAAHNLEESRSNSSGKLDYPGAALLSSGLLLLVLTLTIGKDLGNIAFIFFAVSLLFLFLFRRMQVRKEQPLINTTLFRIRNFNIAIAIAALFMTMLDAYFFILSIYLQDGLRLSPAHAGVFVVCQGIGFILASFISARLVLRYGKNTLMTGTIVIMVSLALQLCLFHMPGYRWVNYILLAIHGAGVALVLPPLANVALKNIPENLAGNASGVYATFQQLFGAFGITVTGGIFFYVVNHYSYYQGMVFATGIHLLCMLGVLLLLLRLPGNILPKKKKRIANTPGYACYHSKLTAIEPCKE
ncbi:drug resistance transporter, EmrB/QacA subfamily [Chitinophaga terrae (ex Kim and Jung 2007)]|uniref:Drug resistance transporter, EmrB/QacA subfamily n=1 Tax=Chitinophaga terrae (ex Kim and Jung 2007) TaxID=408074 RepID=A0A1H3XXX7_9BACT|nr:MFS transporter [Chitinophaga terrae (ex Kim and Jung 2007)]GEP89466.1 MFS transporter [Chitinophaga terrae (ex Kim and Jung 2007)]SEA04319.1 drug resistance transporter, EmrB/QacA subfamily [Chitinophaga terrae (ex Kim and Jung 2007)]